jgi:hypothetical protein
MVLVQSATTHPHAGDEQSCLLRRDPVARHLPAPPPLPTRFAHLCMFVFFLSSLLGRVAVGRSLCSVWMAASDACGPSLWIALAMAGVTAAPRGWHPCACACLFVFPPPLVGVLLGHVCSGASSFLQAPLPLLPPSS